MNQKYNTVTVSYGYTANLGNYETARIDLSVVRNLLPGEDVDAIIYEECDHLKQLIVARVKEAKGASVPPPANRSQVDNNISTATDHNNEMPHNSSPRRRVR